MLRSALRPPRRVLAALALLLLAGCGDAQRTPQAPAPAATPARAPVATLAGEWRVAGIDGADLNEPYGIALRGDADRVWWEPACAGMVRRYAIEGHRITIDPAEQEPAARRPDVPPRAVCTIGLPPRLPEVFAALDAANRIERTPANGILLSGDGRSVTLFSQ